MKLWTKELEQRAIQHPLGSQGENGMDAEVIVKFFNPYGRGVWLITEAKKQANGDWLLFGYCHIFAWECGSVLLSDLQRIKIDIYGCKLGLERDLFAGKHPTVTDLVFQLSAS